MSDHRERFLGWPDPARSLRRSLGIDVPLREVAAKHCALVYYATGGNKRKACKILGISYHALNGHLRRYEEMHGGAPKGATAAGVVASEANA